MKPLFLEIGTEEIPARMMTGALDQLRDRFTDWIVETGIDPKYPESESECTVLGTPRRLVVRARLPEQQNDRVETIKGPPEHVAFEDGQPAPALEGFCRQHGVEPADTTVREQDGGRYVFAEKREPGRATHRCLTRDLEQLVLGMQWPKRMRWESTGTRFIRPIRWLVALFDRRPLEASVGPVEARAQSRGLRFTGEAETFEVKSYGQYLDRLNEHNIRLDPERRRGRIEEDAETLSEEIGGRPRYSEELLSEVNFLVEAPTVFRGEFDEAFLHLPDPVLEETMVSHQKYFPVSDPANEELLPYFIGVRNGGEEGLGVVRRGNERVIQARLSDADFFYHKDLETDFESYRQRLEGVVFQKELGSLHDKTERMARLTRGFDSAPPSLPDLARHCKNDHVTEMVGEFPGLQGVMGRIYAEESGWSPERARALEEHYHPTDRSDVLPASREGTWLSLIDRLDTLVGFFGLGERPTGTADPYGLRREALGLLRILLEREIRWDLREAVRESVKTYRNQDLQLPELDEEELFAFLRDRLYFWFRDQLGSSDRVTEAVLNRFWSRPGRAVQRVKWIQQWRGDDRWEDLVTAAQRVGNITGEVERESPDPKLFEKPQEHRLWETYREDAPEVRGALEDNDPDRLLDLLAGLRGPVDEYFDGVMVMCEDDQLRDNRLRTLRSVRELFDRVADFTPF